LNKTAESMSTSPIINVNNVGAGGASAAKSTVSTSSDQSFSQVLSREVSDRNNTDNSSANATNNNANASANSGANTSSASGSSATGNTAAAGGKPAKSKSSDKSDAGTNGSTTTGTAASNANQSAQLLALVSNVQQSSHSTTTAPGSSGTISASLPVGDALPAQASTAMGNFLALATGTGKAIDTNAAKLASTTISDQPQLNVADELKDEQVTSTATSVSGRVNKTELPVAAPANSGPQANFAGQEVLDLSATAEKNIQAGLATLDANAIKAEQAAQSAPPIVTPVVTQQAMLNVQALSNDPTAKLTPQVGSAGWDQALGQKVVWMVAGGQQNASLTLNPPDLGPMQVVLNVTNSHATVTFSAAQPEVRQALETAMPKLREMLGDAGIQLGQASINSGSAQQQNTAFNQSSQNSSQSGGTMNAGEAVISAARSVQTSSGLGLVDTFA
jgi:flagellar hook-length control protein FliK